MPCPEIWARGTKCPENKECTNSSDFKSLVLTLLASSFMHLTLVLEHGDTDELDDEPEPHPPSEPKLLTQPAPTHIYLFHSSCCCISVMSGSNDTANN